MWKLRRWRNLRCDLLADNVELGGGVLFVATLTDAVDLVVDGGTMVVAVLTGTGDGPLDVRRMPGTDTGDLSETLVCLSRQLLGSPSAGDALETMALGHGNGIDNLVLLEDGVDPDRLLEQTVAKGDFVCNASTVDLDLHQVCLLLLERGLTDLSVGKDTDDSGVFLDALEFAGDG